MIKISSKKASAILIILMTLVIIGIVIMLSSRNDESSTESAAKGFFKESGVDSSSYTNVLKSTEKIIKDAEDSRANIGY